MKFIIIYIICLIVLVPIQYIDAQEQFGPIKNNDIIQLQNMVQTLIEEERYEESIVYLDKIIDLENYNVDALQNKAIVLEKIERYEESYKSFNRILELEPNNQLVAESMWKVLENMERQSTTDSPYTMHVQVTVRDLNGNLLGVLESYNANYLQSEFFEKWWKVIESNGLITEKDDGSQFVQVQDLMIPEHHHTGKFWLDTSIDNHPDLVVNLFNVFIPLMQIDIETERMEIIFTLIKN